MKKIHIYLISDSTGETVDNVAKSALAHFDGLKVEKHLRSMIRKESQLEELGREFERNPGVVMSTIASTVLNKKLKELCIKLNILYIPVLAKVISDLSNYLHIPSIDLPGRQHELNENYFERINTVNYTLTHDDGVGLHDLEEADIVLVGVSRSSKSPTSIYLAYRGYRCANVPFVKDQKLPEELFKLKKPLIVGLTINLERLIDIRKNRLLSIGEEKGFLYTNIEEVAEESEQAMRLFRKNNWPLIDVTRRSIEETASMIIKLFEKKEAR